MTQQNPLSPTREAPITSIQPGGGFCFSLEAAWGRCRRAALRLVFPGYVRRMAALRQGSCAACPHDIIDPRDLKLVRNVCGYSFRPEDDSFAWRGRIGFARAGLCELVVFSLALVTPMLAFRCSCIFFVSSASCPCSAARLAWAAVTFGLFGPRPARNASNDDVASDTFVLIPAMI